MKSKKKQSKKLFRKTCQELAEAFNKYEGRRRIKPKQMRSFIKFLSYNGGHRRTFLQAFSANISSLASHFFQSEDGTPIATIMAFSNAGGNAESNMDAPAIEEKTIELLGDRGAEAYVEIAHPGASHNDPKLEGDDPVTWNPQKEPVETD